MKRAPSFHRGTVRRGRTLRALAGAGAAFGALVGGLALGAGPGAASTASPLQRGLAFYRGKTITLLTDGQPAGPYDLYARAIAPYLGAYLHATVNVEDLTIGNGIGAMDIAASAPASGVQAGVMQLFTPISEVITNTPGLNFNIEREAWINAEAAAPQILLAASSSPFTSISAIKNARGTLKAQVGASTSLAGALTRGLLGVLGANAQFVSGYTNTSLEVAGFARGDGQVVMLPLTTAGPLVADGFARPVAITVVPAPGAEYRSLVASAPTFAQILKRYPPATKSTRAAAAALAFIASSPSALLTLPTAVSSEKVEAFRAAIAWTFKQKGFKSQMLTDGLNPTFVDPVQAKAAYAASLKNDAALSCYILGSC